jgi:Kef-type K+ transport system membrane component KefB
MHLGILALICAAALLGPALTLLTRGAIPAVVGQLVAGVLLGQTALNVVHPGSQDFTLLYDVGFATLMLTVGMHVPLHDTRLRSALGDGARATLTAIPLAAGAGFLCHLLGGGPTLVYAVIIVSSSAAVALPVIEESKLEGPAILAAMAWITIADIGATIAIPLVLVPSHAAHSALGALIVAALVAALVVLTAQLRHLPQVQDIRRESKKRGWAIDLRLAVIALVGLSWVAIKVGASILIAGFGVGLVIAARGGPKRLSHEVLGLGQAFFIPVFFVLLGSKLDLRALGNSTQSLLLAPVLAALAIGVHILASRSIRTPAAIGLLASAQMGVPAAVIALGLPAHAINQAQASAIFCAVLISIGACAAGAAILRLKQPGQKAQTPGYRGSDEMATTDTPEKPATAAGPV